MLNAKKQQTNSVSHDCNAIVFTCIDFRFHPAVESFFKKTYKSFDLVSIAGSVKLPQFMMEQIKISSRLHHIKKIVLTMHIDCGAWGGSKAFKNDLAEINHHQEVLKRAETILSKKISLPIHLYLIRLTRKKHNWIPIPQKAGVIFN